MKRLDNPIELSNQKIVKMDIEENNLKKLLVLFITMLLTSTTILVVTPTTLSADPQELGQVKVKEGFETWPPVRWYYSGILTLIQTTGDPEGECMIGHHAAKICTTEYDTSSAPQWSLLSSEKLKTSPMG